MESSSRLVQLSGRRLCPSVCYARAQEAYHPDGADNRSGKQACLCSRGSSAAPFDRHRRRPLWGTDKESTMLPTMLLGSGPTVSNLPSRLNDA